MTSSPLVALLYAALINSILQEPGMSPEVNKGQQEAVLVTVSSGQLRGVKRVLSSAHVINEFKGIQYAQPPTGDLRFAPPQPPLPWSGVKDASRHGNYCPQNITIGTITNVSSMMSEDCLYLNVYSPCSIPTSPLPSSALLPVMVWIHGGGFNLGTGSDYDGAFLATRGQVIVVTLNYRLGALGFLSTEDDVIPGNFGLLDQVQALKWVRINIRHFGGDPGRVTVMGQSAGGHSVSLLSLSPLAAGLFQRAIPQSGASIAPTSYYRTSEVLSPSEVTAVLAAKLGCGQHNSTSKSLLTCLRSKPVGEILQSDLATVSEAESETNYTIILLWKPRVDGPSGFLPDDPRRLLSTGLFHDVDTMHGYCSGEMSVFVKDPEDDGVTVEECRESLVSSSGLSTYTLNKTEVAERVLSTIFQGVSSPIARRSKLIKVESDFQMASPITHEVDSIVTSAAASSKRHFLYRLSYRGSLHPDIPQWAGVSHASDLPFVFGFDSELSSYFLKGHEVTPTDRKVSELMMDMWSNFAKYGHPTQQSPLPTGGPSWPEFTTGQRLVLDINENLSVQPVDWAALDGVYQLMNNQL